MILHIVGCKFEDSLLQTCQKRNKGKRFLVTFDIRMWVQTDAGRYVPTRDSAAR